jgi:hypothetical protein
MKDPENTSAVIVLPNTKGRQTDWLRLLTGFELVAQYTHKDRIYKRSKDGGCYLRSGNTDIWYDPADTPDQEEDIYPTEQDQGSTDLPTSGNQVASTSSYHATNEMLFAAKLAGYPAIALADTGADGEYISEKFLQANGLELSEQVAGRETECAGGQRLQITGSIKAHFRMASFSAHLEFNVVPELLDGVDIILGRSFMRSYRVCPDVAGRKLRLKPPGKRQVTIHSLNLARRTKSGVGAIRNFIRKSLVEPSEVEPLSAKRAWKELKRGAEHMLVLVRESQPSRLSSHKPPGDPAESGYPRPQIARRETRCPRQGPATPGRPLTTLPGSRISGIGGGGAGKHTSTRESNYVATESRQGQHELNTIRAPEAEGSFRAQQTCGEEPDTKGVSLGTTSPKNMGITSGLVPENTLQQLLAEYAEVFPADLPPGLPPEREIGHVIPLQQNAIPPYRRNRRMSPSEVALCEEYLRDLLQKGFITPSTSPFGAPVMFIAKPAGGYRVVCDWRALNNITIKNRYPLPRIDETLDRLGGATVFSSLDLNSGYFQIRISDEDAKKTAFTTPLGQYEFKVLGQGLANSPATFQSVMNRIFAPHLYKFVVVYLDDILVFSKSPEEHVEHLRTVLDLLRQHKFYAKKEKCSFNQPEVKFLGHIVGRDGLKVDPKKVDTVTKWPTPKNATEVRQFLGLTNYFRKFIKDYSTLAAPLNDLTKKDTNFQETFKEVHLRSFEALKEALTTAPVLILPDFTKPFELISDASLLGTGAVLLQEGRVVAYTSRKFSSAEKNYTTT